MGEAYFYHLTRGPLEQTLPVLLERSLAQGWRVGLRAMSMDRLNWLDQRLWLGAEDGFLPHGVIGGDHDAYQPILLSTGDLPNSPQCVMCIDGAPVDPEEVRQMARVCILFDGNDEMAVDHARGQWRALTQAGCGAKYWSEETGSWRQKAESPAKEN
jgi:DNA polymerase-3 subunit chi